ncbi:hypothetical protein STEG23_011670, partial [Scotinomys teguina]
MAPRAASAAWGLAGAEAEALGLGSGRRADGRGAGPSGRQRGLYASRVKLV